jgi:hypothetical protein
MAPREVTRERPKPGNRSAAAASSVIGFLRALIHFRERMGDSYHQETGHTSQARRIGLTN